MEEQCFLCGSDQFHTHYGGSKHEIHVCWVCQNEIDAGIDMTVSKKCRIEMAHSICGHETCGEIHGHSVDIIVSVRGPMNFMTGMVIDFKTLKYYIQEEIIKKFDHQYMNNILPVPTAEYLAFYIFKQLKYRNLNVVSVRVHETKNNYAEYDGNTTFTDEEDGFCGERQDV